MLKQEEKKLRKKLIKLHEECLVGDIGFDSYFYLGDFNLGENRFAMWFHHDDYKKLKQHILYITILFEAKLPFNNEFIDSLKLNKDTSHIELSVDEKRFLKFFNEAIETSGFEEFKSKLAELVELINEVGIDIKIDIFKNAKEALPKALDLDRQAGEDEYSFSKILISLMNSYVN